MSLIFILTVLITILSGALVIYYYFTPQRTAAIRLLSTPQGFSYDSKFSPSQFKPVTPSSTSSQSINVRGARIQEYEFSSKVTLDERLFRAGLLTVEQKKSFYTIKRISPIAVALIGAGLGSIINFNFIIMGSVVGLLLGIQLPTSYLDRKTLHRDDEIMRFLPLVIEQLVIGVSSSLEIGPCIQRVVTMADERDSHNVVTELLKHVHQLIIAGSTLDEALIDIGSLSGHTELKHSFISLSQVSRHGGEITRQLQELADAVSSQRETKIDAKIKKLELEATGPVALVFISFMAVLLVGIGLQIAKALGNT